MSELRIGLGVDAHALAEGVPLVLGGVRFDHPRGLVGHSDGDVLAHALVDALLGAAPRDPRFFPDQHTRRVHQLPPLGAHTPVCLGEHLQRVDPLERRIS